jgi:phosphoribosylformimino-5-aminoimidazole carboxamide ribotide isomerase
VPARDLFIRGDFVAGEPSQMLIIPAIDLRGGKCVRLLRGDYDRETVYGDDPVAMGRRWVEEGATFLHVVDLDGALQGQAVNGTAIAGLCSALSIPIQVGGGVRTVERAGALLGMGVDRVIFGTAALEQPEVVADACRRFAGRIAVGIDARDGKVAVKGWTETSAVEAVDLARRMQDVGAARIIYTDIGRDGTQEGVNAEATAALADALEIPVIASGGVGSLAHIEALLPYESRGVEGVIVGRALYTGAVTLGEALARSR